jgi:hypothetical protein
MKITITLITSILFTLSLPIRVHTQSDIDLTTAPSCSTQQVADWTYVREKMLGVAGRDAAGHEVGFSGAKKRFGGISFGGNWLPISGSKETLCGTLDHFGFFPGVWEIDREEDWNNFIIPDPDFKYLIAEAQQLFPDAVKSTPKCNGADCIEVEITVHDNFFENPYFTRHKQWLSNNPSSILTGQKVCTYGTWIHEKVHDDHPELHPSELFWWVPPPSPQGTSPFSGWWLMAVQDNSNRFNSASDFDPETLPWAGPPRTNQFKLAVELKPGQPMLSLRVNQVENHGVIPSLEDSGTTHSVNFNGVPLASVTEGQATENVGVRFDFCRDTAANRFVGYVELTSRLQTDDDGNAGFQVLQVIKEDASISAAPRPTPTKTQQPAEPITKLRLVADSLRRVEVNGQTRLVADLTAEVPVARTENREAAAFKKMRLLKSGKKENIQIDRQSGDSATSLAASQFVLHDVPLALGQPLSGTTFEVETVQGKQTLEIRDLALVPEVNRETVLVQSQEPGALERLLLAAGLGVGPQPESFPSIDTVKTQQATLDLVPTYAVLREDGTLAREDESPIVSALNESVRKASQDNDFTTYDRLFKTRVPFRVTAWKFKAVNLITGQEVPVRDVSEGSDAADANEVRVSRGSGNVANGNLKVLFPKQTPGAVYELQMNATMKDANGYTGTFERRLWSHFIRVPKTQDGLNNFLRMVAQRAGVSYEQLSSLWQASAAQISATAQTRRARIFRTLGLQAIADEKVNLDELQALSRAAKLAGQR